MIHDLIGLGKSAKPNQPLPISLQWVMPLVKAVVPIRLINGIEDPVSGKHAADRFNEVVPHADVVLLENCGHYSHVETPKEVLKAFFDFYDKL